MFATAEGNKNAAASSGDEAAARVTPQSYACRAEQQPAFVGVAGTASDFAQPHAPHLQISQVQNSPLQLGQRHSVQPQAEAPALGAS